MSTSSMSKSNLNLMHYAARAGALVGVAYALPMIDEQLKPVSMNMAVLGIGFAADLLVGDWIAGAIKSNAGDRLEKMGFKPAYVGSLALGLVSSAISYAGTNNDMKGTLLIGGAGVAADFLAGKLSGMEDAYFVPASA